MGGSSSSREAQAKKPPKQELQPLAEQPPLDVEKLSEGFEKIEQKPNSRITKSLRDISKASNGLLVSTQKLVEGINPGPSKAIDYVAIGLILIEALKWAYELVTATSTLLTAVAIAAAAYAAELQAMLQPMWLSLSNFFQFATHTLQKLSGPLFSAVKNGLEILQGATQALYTFIKSVWSVVAQVGKTVCSWIVKASKAMYSAFQTYLMPILKAIVQFAAAHPLVCLGLVVGLLVLVGGVYLLASV